MDKLHGVMRALHPERKSEPADKPRRAPDHLSVFREFISHLDRMSRQASVKASRVKAPRALKRKTKR